MIGKAPVLLNVFLSKRDQRDADHQYYPKTFYEWGNEFCVEHLAGGYTGGNYRLRRECPKCWQSLLQQAEGK